MIDAKREKLIGHKEACKHPLLTGGGAPLSYAAWLRYTSAGVISTSGERVKLESIKTPGRGRVTSEQAIERFVAHLSGTREYVGAYDGPPDPSDATSGIPSDTDAAKLLDSVGI